METDLSHVSLCFWFVLGCCWQSWRPSGMLGPSSHRSTSKLCLDTEKSSRGPWTSLPSRKSSPTTSMCCQHSLLMCAFIAYRVELNIFFNDYRYLNLETFIIDVNLVFDNCEKFNEDDSEIGRAGHNMRRFFDRRWTELLQWTSVFQIWSLRLDIFFWQFTLNLYVTL